jgi:hypothetical protein
LPVAAAAFAQLLEEIFEDIQLGPSLRARAR